MKALVLRSLCISLFSFIMLSGCKNETIAEPEVEEPKPTAGFTFVQTDSNDPFTFAFSNNSTNFSLTRWEFGDDSSSTETSPTHTFLKTGEFTTLLRTENSQDYWAQRQAEIKIIADSILEMTTKVNGDGTLKVSVSTEAALDSVYWYQGKLSTGEDFSNDQSIDIPVMTGRFDYYTLKGRTPKGSIVEITRLLTDLGIVRDVTDKGVFSVSRDNDGGKDANEGSKKLVDNDITTKFLQGGFSGDLWFQLEFYDSVILGGYTFTSGNDAKSRDPLNWRLEASNDAVSWTVLDTRTAEDFPTRRETKTFIFSNTKAYNFYRIYVTNVVSGTLFQMSEWRVLSLPKEN